MTQEKVRVEGGEIEATAGLVHELQAVGVLMVVKLLVDPRDGLLDGGFAGGH
jgi:hypothetical protein